MSDCAEPKLRELLLPYLEGELDERDAMAVTIHLGACEICAKESDELRESLKFIAAAGCPPREALLACLEGKPADERARRHVARCPECRAITREFNALEHPEPRDRSVKIPMWLDEKLREVFPKRSRLGGFFTFLVPSRAGIAFAACTVLALIFLFSGLWYNAALNSPAAPAPPLERAAAPPAPVPRLAAPQVARSAPPAVSDGAAAPRFSVMKKEAARSAPQTRGGEKAAPPPPPAQPQASPALPAVPLPMQVEETEARHAAMMGLVLYVLAAFFAILAGVMLYRLLKPRK